MEPSRNRLLASLAASDMVLVSRQLSRGALDHGAVLQQQDAPVQQVYFPLEGAISLLAVMRSGDEVETATIGREGAVGLFADFGRWHSCIKAVVQAPGTAEIISLPALRTIVSYSEAIGSLMLRYKETLFAQTQQTVACNTLHSVQQRMARWLLQVSDRTEGREFLATQDMLSQMLGVRRTTITLIAMKFQRGGLLRYRRGHIQLTNRAALHALACECYDTCRRQSEALLSEPDLLKASPGR